MIKIPDVNDYPERIHLRGSEYKIRFVSGMKSLGETDTNKQEIRIRKGMSKNETFRTFLHELLHFIEMEWPINLKHKQVYKLEKAIFQLIIDNFI